MTIGMIALLTSIAVFAICMGALRSQFNEIQQVRDSISMLWGEHSKLATNRVSKLERNVAKHENDYHFSSSHPLHGEFLTRLCRLEDGYRELKKNQWTLHFDPAKRGSTQGKILGKVCYPPHDREHASVCTCPECQPEDPITGTIPDAKVAP